MKSWLKGMVCAAVGVAAVCGAAACAPAPVSGEAKLSFAGNLQKLYGGTDGYPQAVLVAKTSVIENAPAAVAQMESYMAGSAAYLAEAQPQTVVSLLSECYEPDLAPSFNANNLTSQVISNCSVKYTPAAAGKEKVVSFLTALNGMDASLVTGVPGDAFFYAGGAAAGTVSGSYRVFAPDGAPALALSYAISEAEGETFEYNIVAADSIRLKVTGDSPEADFCILPVNLAANLLRSGEKYKMLGTVTNGNMFLLSTHTDKPAIEDTEDLSLLIGSKIGVVQLANVPGLTLRLTLENAGVGYKILTEADASLADDKVNLVAVGAGDVTLAGGYDYFLCPEPAASAKVKASAK